MISQRIDFNRFCGFFLSEFPQQLDRAIGFLWFRLQSEGEKHATVNQIGDYFARADLHAPNLSRLSKQLKNHKGISFDRATTSFRMAREKREELDALLSHLVVKQAPSDFVENVDILRAPFLSQDQFGDARKMAEMYVVLHCLENSIRSLIERVLEKRFGNGWWEQSASSPMKRKHEKRLKEEESDKWLPTRARSGPLYSIDWPDLITLVRKFEDDFIPYIGDIKFMHRFEDLGKLRNIVAHHGILKDPRQFERVALHFHDWVEQIGNISVE